MRKDLFSELEKEHADVKSILRSMSFLTDGAAQKREDLFQKLRQELLPHLKAEESVFYPFLEGDEDVQRDAFEAAEQHHLIEIILDELDATPRDAARWRAKLSVLRELLERHISDEEDRVFDDAREVMTRDQIDDVYHRYVQEKQRIARSMETIPVS